jgi:hypothetical protein
MKPIISKNLTPQPPSLPGNGGFKASPRRGERFGEGFVYTLKTFQTSSKGRGQDSGGGIKGGKSLLIKTLFN